MNKNGDKSIKMSNIKLDYKSSKGLKVYLNLNMHVSREGT